MVIWIVVVACSLMILASLVLALFLGKYGQRGPYFQEKFGWRVMVQVIWLAALVLFFMVPVGIGLMTVPRFDSRMLELLFRQAIPVALVAPPVALLLARGNFDFSITAAMGLAGTIMMYFSHHDSTGVGIVLGILAALGLGTINGLIVAITRAPSFIVTLTTTILAAFLTMEMTQNQNFMMGDTMSESLVRNGTSALVWWPVIALGAIALIVLAEATPMGRASKMLPHEEGVGRRLLVVMPAFAICGFAAGLAGIFSGLEYRAAGPVGASDVWRTIQCVMLVVLGGTAYKGRNVAIVGAVVAAIGYQGLWILETIRTVDRPLTSNLMLGLLLLSVMLLGQQYHNFFAWIYQRRQARKQPQGFAVEAAKPVAQA